jgi:uncharacterized protein (UPF0548 family)
MRLITSATLSWFDTGCCDVKYLDEWQTVPLSFTPGQVTDSSWYSDSYQKVIMPQASAHAFQRATDLLFRYQFYPQQILSFTSDFKRERRRLRVGDRIVQRIHLFHLWGRVVLDMMSMVEVTAVIDEPRRAGFSYVTVSPHVAQGQWQFSLNWRESGDLHLSADVVLRPNPAEPAGNHSLIRFYQRRADQQGLAHFAGLVQPQPLAAGGHILAGGG